MRRPLLAAAVLGLVSPLGTSLVAFADGELDPPASTPDSTVSPAESTVPDASVPTTTTAAPPPEPTAPPVPESTVPETSPPPPQTTVPPPPPPTVPPPPPEPVVPPSPEATSAPPGPAALEIQPTNELPPPVPDRHDDVNPHPPAPATHAHSGRVVVPSGAVDGGELRAITFPVAGPVTYVNDFGDCRDRCRRSHQGNDLIGDRLQPLLAMHDGIIHHLVDHPTAGYGVVIRDAEGWEYRTYHVNNDTPGTDDGRDGGTWRFPEGIVPGAHVRAGQLIGWMGDSGNSEGSVPHAHVEIRRPGGEAINPYWSLRRAQRDVNCRRGPLGESVTPADAGWLATGWAAASLPPGWLPLGLTGGHPRSRVVAARMWVGPLGFTPVDAAALRVGDTRYDQPLDCTPRPETSATPTVPAELGAVLAAIRAIESGGDYTAAARSSTASGAYQFLDRTWNRYGGYRRALDAPPEVQDAKAAEWASAILARNGGDVSTVPVSWYLGHVPVGGEWDRVPPYPGNSLTPRQYLDRWMTKYSALLGRADLTIVHPVSWTPVDTSMTCHTVVVDVGDRGAPRFVMTQAQRFVAGADGRAVPAASDPCDPARQPSEPPPSNIATLPDRPRRGVA